MFLYDVTMNFALDHERRKYHKLNRLLGRVSCVDACLPIVFSGPYSPANCIGCADLSSISTLRPLVHYYI